MSIIVDESSTTGAPEAATDLLRKALSGLDLAEVPDSLRAARYAVSSVNPAGQPTLQGVQVSSGTGAIVDAGATVVGTGSVHVAQSSNLVIVDLVGDSASPGDTYFYGTTPAGAKAFVQIGSVLHGSPTIVATVNADGTVTFSTTGTVLFNTTAAAAVSSNTVVTADSGGGVRNPDLATGSDVAAICGVAFTSATTGNPIQVMREGTLTEALWSWTPGLPIYCALTGGAFTQTPPATGAVIAVGVALTATSVQVGIGPAYLLN